MAVYVVVHVHLQRLKHKFDSAEAKWLVAAAQLAASCQARVVPFHCSTALAHAHLWSIGRMTIGSLSAVALVMQLQQDSLDRRPVGSRRLLRALQ